MTENHGEKELLTREEVMELLKIGRSTFYRLLQTGQLKGFKATPHNCQTIKNMI